jgi:hypothetical protein
MASQSHKICVAHSASSRNLKQVGSSVNPSLKRCPLRGQCPVNSPITNLNWSLFSFNTPFVLLAECHSINPFACLSPAITNQIANQSANQITLAKTRTTCPQITINNRNIPRNTEVKYLGLYLDQKLTWRTHIKKK